MAQQATVRKAAETTEPAPKRGRPAGSRNLHPVVKKPKVFDYSRFKVTLQKPEDFYLYLAGYPDLTGLMGYVYRLRPRIDLSLIGIAETSIMQSHKPEELTEEFIGSTYGRGVYMVKLNDANRPKGQQECCRTWFDIADVEKPPQYDPRTLCLGEAKNQDEITRLLNAGVLVRDTHGAPRLRNEGDLPAAAPAAAGSVPGSGNGGELFSRDVMGQVLLGLLNRNTQDPHATVRDTIEVAKLIAPPPAPAVDVEQIIERVVTRLNGTRPAPLDEFAVYERVEGFMARMRGGPVAPAPPVGPAGVVADVAAAAAAGGGFNWGPIIGAAVAALVPTILRRLEAPAANGVPNQQQMNMLQRIEEVAGIGLGKMSEGVTGFDFAAWVCHYHPGGLEVYTYLEPKGVPGVMALMAMNAASRPLLSDPAVRAQIETFLADFFSFDPMGGAAVTDPAAASPAAMPASA